MKRFLRNAAYISIFAIIFAFAGCNDFYSDDDSVVEPVASTTKNKNDGKAYLTVSVNGSIARMISPNDITQAEITRAELLSKASDAESSSLVKNWQSDESKNAFEKMTSDTEILIDAGTYDFTLNLYAGDVFCQTGTLSSVEISAGNNPLSFSTKYVENGRGNFSVTLTWTQSERVSSVKAGLFTIASLGEERARGYEFSEIAVTAGEENNYAATYAKDEVTNGAYIIRFELYADDGTKLNTLEDVIQIATACSTQKTIPLSNVNTIYTISYEKNGGDWAEDFTPTEKHNANTAVILPSEENISRIGYEFAGWHTSEDGGETLSENTLLAINAGTADDFTLYAKWEPATVKYTVKHLLQNADDDDYTESEEDRETLYGKTESETEAVAKEYEHFTAKAIAQAAILPDGSSVVEIKYDRNIYTVTFESMGGSEVLSQSVKYGKKANIPNVPTDSLRNFEGWYNSTDNGVTLSKTPFDFSSDIIANVTLYAKWDTTVYANNVAAVIASMTKSGTVVVKGKISNATLTAIKDAINHKNFGIEIDLSETEGLTNIGEESFYGCSRLTSVKLPDSVKSIGWIAFSGCSGLKSIEIPSSVTSIGNSAFYGCSGLESIEIMSGVTSIGKFAFYGCSGLKSIEIPSSVTSIEVSAFDGCSGLESIEIMSGVTSIGKQMFLGCSGLKSITIPSSVTNIGESAFYGCSGLENIEIMSGVTSIGEFAFSGCSGLKCIEIPSSVTNIGGSAFSGCSGLENIEIMSGVTSIGNYAFSGCSGLESIEIPSSVTSIGGSAFDGCSGLKEITIPFIGTSVTDTSGSRFSRMFGGDVPNSLKTVTINGSITSIGDYAFDDCSGLKSIEIPSSVTSIGRFAFDGCSGLTSITIPETVTSIGEFAFDGCSGLTSITIPEKVTSIGGSAFSGCSGLTSIVIPSSVTSIGEESFYGCSGLESVEIPEGVTSIGRSAFSGCSRLTSITIPDSVTSIGSSAFSGCSGLTEITIPFIGTSVTDTSVRFYDIFEMLNSSSVPASLKDVRITGSVTNIGILAFSGCSGLESVEIPEGVTSIGISAFSDCSGLESIVIPSSVTSIGSSAFSGCSGLESIVIPSSVTTIEYDAFSGCNNLKSIYYGGTLEQWMTITFSNYGSNPCRNGADLYIGGENISNVKIADGVTNIGNSAFSGCIYLTTVEISDGVTSIGEKAFDGCSCLTTIEIPDSVTSIGEKAFDGCSCLKSVYYGGTLEQWLTITFSSYGSNPCRNGADLYIGGEKVTNVKIPDGVASIGGSAFYGCSGLTSITIPSSVTSIGGSAFYGCSGLTSITFAGTVSQWKSVIKGAYWNQNVPATKVVCSDGEVEL